MLKISYNANGLRGIPLAEAIGEVAAAGYDGIELSLHPNHLDPFALTPRDLGAIGARLRDSGLEPACLATGADNLLSNIPFEPSLIHPDPAGRSRRIDLIKRSIDLARRLGITVVNFASGILREGISRVAAWGQLVEGIRECLERCGDDVLLAIEPEVGFLVEANVQALTLLSVVSDPRLRINQDVGHENVYEARYLDSIRLALPSTRHMHVEDIKARRHYHEIPGEGDIDFPALIRALLAQSYPHYISVELYNHADVYKDALRKSLAYLRSTEESVATELEGCRHAHTHL
jgi:sugar phosphate isomerase/epimerase